MEKIKNVFSPGHQADDELMYGSGKTTAADGTSTGVTGNPVRVEGSEHAKGSTLHHGSTVDSGFEGRDRPDDMTHDFAAPAITQQTTSQTTKAVPDDRLGLESSERGRQTSWNAHQNRDHKVTQGPFGEDSQSATGAAAPYMGPKGTAEPLPEMQEDHGEKEHKPSKAGGILGAIGLGSLAKKDDRDKSNVEQRQSRDQTVHNDSVHNDSVHNDPVSSDHSGSKAGAILGHSGIGGGTRRKSPHRDRDAGLAIPDTRHNEQSTKAGAILGSGDTTHHSQRTEQTRDTPARNQPIGVAGTSPHQGTFSQSQATDRQTSRSGMYATQQVPQETSRSEDSHTGRNTAIGAAAAAGAGGVGAHEFSKRDAEKQDKAALKEQEKMQKEHEKEQHAHDKAVAKEHEKAQKEHEKEQHAHDKAIAKEHEKAQKEHEKEVKKEEKEHAKAVKKEEKEHEKAIKKEEKQAEKEHEKAIKREEKEHEKAIKKEEKQAEKEHEKAVKEGEKAEEKAEREHEKVIIAQRTQAEKDHKREVKEEEKLEKDHSDGEGKKKGGILGFFKRDKHRDEGEEEDHSSRNIAAGTAGAAAVGAGAYAGQDRHEHNKLHKDPPADHATKGSQTYTGDKATPAYADYAVVENKHPGAQTITGGYTAPAPKDDPTKTKTHTQREQVAEFPPTASRGGYVGTASSADYDPTHSRHTKEKTTTTIGPETEQRRETAAQFPPSAGGGGYAGTASSADYNPTHHPSSGQAGVKDNTTIRSSETQQDRTTATQFPSTGSGGGYTGTASSADYTSHTQTPKASTVGDPSVGGVTALPTLPNRTAPAATTQDTSGVGFAHPSNDHAGAAKQVGDAEAFDGPVMERPRGTEVEGQGDHMPGEYPEKI